MHARTHAQHTYYVPHLINISTHGRQVVWLTYLFPSSETPYVCCSSLLGCLSLCQSNTCRMDPSHTSHRRSISQSLCRKVRLRSLEEMLELHTRNRNKHRWHNSGNPSTFTQHSYLKAKHIYEQVC